MVSLKNRFNVLKKCVSVVTNIRISNRINLKIVFLEYQFLKMQKRLLFFSVIFLISSCTKQVSTIENYRKNFTSEEQKIISFSESLIKQEYLYTIYLIQIFPMTKN